MFSTNSAAAQYKRINTESALDHANPHQLIQMLINGAIERLIQAKAAMQNGDIALKGLLLGKATMIIGGLQSSLDPKHARDLVDNLDALYDYMQRRLLEANIRNYPAMIDEVCNLMRTVKSAWDQIVPSA